MTEEQKIRLYLLQQNNGNLVKAREACEFIMGEESKKPQQPVTVPYPKKDGVYLFYEDGHEEFFTGDNHIYDVIGISVYVGERHTILGLKDLVVEEKDEFPLLKTSGNDTEEDVRNFKNKHYMAYSDLDGKKNTESLLRRGCPVKLEKGQYIPSAGEWLIVFMNYAKVQEALKYINEEPLKDDWYWSSTEYSSANAWYVSASTGYIGCNYNETNTGRVRPCLSCEAI